MLAHERLVHALRYEPDTGLFYWNIAGVGRRNSIGELTNNVGPGGYVRISLDHRRYQAHRLAWFYVHGAWPVREIDHRNGIRTDNRIANLRDVPKIQNQQNLVRATAVNKIGVLGVTMVGRRYRASIGHAGKHFHLGLFGTSAEAHAAYVSAKRILHPGSTL